MTVFKYLHIVLVLLGLSACADMSMYNQVPAPIGHPGQARTEVTTYPIESPSYGAIEEQQVQQPQQTPNVVSGRNPAVIALLDDAQQKQQLGQFGIAASKLERAVRIAPRDAVVWHQLAEIRFQQYRYQSAESLAKKSILYSSNDSSLLKKNWLLIARCRDELGNSDAARLARTKADEFR